jgi:hypothetical protein
MITTIIRCDIDNISVDEEYYSFDYVISVNGVKRKKERYESDYQNGKTPKEWRKELERGIATEIALQNLTIN